MFCIYSLFNEKLKCPFRTQRELLCVLNQMMHFGLLKFMRLWMQMKEKQLEQTVIPRTTVDWDNNKNKK